MGYPDPPTHQPFANKLIESEKEKMMTL